MYKVWLVLLFVETVSLLWARQFIVRNPQCSVSYIAELVLESLKLIQNMQGPVVKGLLASYFQRALVVEVVQKKVSPLLFFEVGSFFLAKIFCM